jgi:hypothetical protein
MCAVTAAPGPAGVRVWAVMSRDGGHEGGACRRRALMLPISSPQAAAEGDRGHQQRPRLCQDPADAGVEPKRVTGAQMAAAIQRELEMTKRVVKAKNITLD